MRSYGANMVQASRLTALPTTSSSSGGTVSDGSSGAGSGTPWDAGAGDDKDTKDSVMVCLVSSGIDASAPALSNSTLDGCEAEHPLNPGGCPWLWSQDSTGQGTHLASIIAGVSPVAKSQALGVMPGAELYSVRAWDKGSPAGGSSGDGAFAKDRLLPYTVCEGKLRGYQAENFGHSNYRMVRQS